ncbi:MAG: radical SAM family heme chaperone HemW [Planctomycetota bacterium]|nr:radical SAM family heme chaperone HemW [Planctomycetota bacterium]
MDHHQPAPEGTPLYVHLPFCVHLCPYCDFFSVDGKGQDVDGFLDTLLLEAEARAPKAPRTVFFGGGTPTYLSEPQLQRLLLGLDELTGFRASAEEVTVECNPESLTLPKAQLMRSLGVDRLSIGVQSLDPETLAFFERPHGPEQALAAVEATRSAGFERFSIDLIHGSPTEELATTERNLLQLLELRPQHVSAYGLTYEPGTPLHARLEREEFVPQDEDQELANLDSVHRLLEDAGLRGYEVSNYSSIGQECLHNVNYWHNGPYVGIGPSAASHAQGTRSGNPRSIPRWRAAKQADPMAAAFEEHLDPRARLGETWWLGLRLAEGVDPEVARTTAGWVAAEDPAVGEAEALVAEGLLELLAGRYRLTPRARPLADHVGRQFLV